MYNGYKVVINSRDAYHHFDNDMVRYAKYKKVKGQKVIRYSDDPRYYMDKCHPHGTPPGQAKKYIQKEIVQETEKGMGSENINHIH